MRNKIKRTIIYIGIFILLFLISIPKIIMGYQIDENFFISMTHFILKGEIIFKNLKTVLSTASFLQTPFLWIYNYLFSESIGVVLFMRLVGESIHIAFSAFFYIVIKDIYGKRAGISSALVFYLFIPGWMSSLTYKNIYFYFALGTTLFLILYFREKKQSIFLIFAALCCTICVFSYPTMVLLFPYYLYLIWHFNHRQKYNCAKRDGIVFGGICLTFCILFLCYIVMTTKALPLIGTNSVNDSRGVTFLNKLLNMALTMVGLCVVSYSPVIFLSIFQKKVGIDLTKTKSALLYYHIIISILVMFLFYGIKLSTANSNRMLFVFAVMIMWSPYFYRHFCEPYDKILLYLFWIQGLIMLVAMGMATTDARNFRTSGVGIFFGVFAIIIMVTKKRENRELERAGLYFVSVICLFLLITRAYYVSVTKGEKKHVFDMTHRIEEGPASGVFVTGEYYELYNEYYEILSGNVNKSDRLLALCNEPIVYLMTEAQSGTCETGFAAINGTEFLDYYSQHPDKIPTKILIDWSYVGDNGFFDQTPLGRWIVQKFDFDHPINWGRCSIVGLRTIN